MSRRRWSMVSNVGYPAPLRAALAAVAVGAAGSLAGCAGMAPPAPATRQLPPSAAAFVQSAALPGSATLSQEPVARFWQRFGDADLDALINEALAANRDIQVTAARLREVRALQRLASVGDRPVVGTSASVARLRTADGQGGNDEGNAFGLGLDARWEWDLFGRRANEKTAAAALVRSGEAALQGSRLAVAAEVARQYFELRGLQERLRVARESLVTQREALKLVQGRLEAGRGTALDTERARALVFSTEAAVPALELALTATGHRIAVLRGQAPGGVDARLATVKPLPGLQAIALDAIGSPQSLLRRRPDLIAAEEQAVAAAANVGVAYKARYPRITLGGTLGLNAGRLSDLGSAASFVYNLGASLAYSVFDNVAIDEQTEAAAARELAAVRAHEAAVLVALEETETALASYTRTQQQAASLFQAAQAADKASELARARFAAGVSDFLAVLDAERERLAARERLSLAQTAAAVSVVSVYKALGGDVGQR